MRSQVTTPLLLAVALAALAEPLPAVPGLRGGAHRSAGPGVQSGGRFSGRLGVSALFLSGVSVDPTTLAYPAVDGISFFIYWRDFYTNQNDPNSIDWTKVDTVFT